MWEQFVGGLGDAIKVCREQHLSLFDPQLDLRLGLGETLRLDMAGRQHTVLTEFRDPLARILNTSVLVPGPYLMQMFFAQTRDVYDEEAVRVPMGPVTELYVISEVKLEQNVSEARLEITRRRRRLQADEAKLKIILDEAQQAHSEARQYELDSSRAEKWTTFTWRAFKGSTVGKVLWWFGEAPLRQLLGTAILAGAAATIRPIRDGIGAAFQWVVSRF